ncbi:DNA-3-methyladenine glycosylase [Chloroflexota bacterium]
MTPQTSFVLDPVSPFDLNLTAWTLRRRADNMMDRWDGETYRRVLIIGDKPFEIAVTQFDESGAPRLRVSLMGEGISPNVKTQVVAALERLLGIYIDLTKFYRFAKKDKILRSPVDQFRGVKPPRLQSYFETLVNAIACQQLTLTVGIRLLNRLTETCGIPLKTEAGIFHAFPRPQDLAVVDIETLRGLGYSYRKAEYLTGLAQAILDGQFNFEEIEEMDDKEAVKYLCGLRGVGRWTAEYFLLRGMGRTHIFPGDDVGARNNLQKWLSIPESMTYAGVQEILQRWDGYGGLIYFHLLLKSLTEKGLIFN